MSKFVLPMMGVGGASAAAAGGYMLLKENNHPQVQKEETFNSKYSKAILEESSDLWESKFQALKESNSLKHPTLKKAKEKEAKDLHKQGCREIYASPLNDSPYLEDFKTYCAKNIKDAMDKAKTWISQDESDTTHWNPKLKNLKEHDSNKNKTLSKGLEDLKASLSGVTGEAWTEDHRQKLKDWCDASQTEIFIGEGDSQFEHSKLYCLAN
ncbi:hypothetical protein HF1_08600 [Mycoplasma haemofelis str. Langford 1]|uniref:Uncharacterized protein n=2 Tax=Mycoplasma haemofelis TaxID=29501 RepID=F6FIZ8_MYCHI|nr:hypothetical protein [Mycoplasma haemofelis]AEG73196.1 hypothetical protein MHF_0939 [Mycoplasma haemofelis Ohio2]CBY92868.1 hypothetical protein HF1_08600 [Mycoplasma haemofelis str. Langford 1]